MNSIITRQNGIMGFHKWRAMLVLALLMCFGAGEAFCIDYTGTYWFSPVFTGYGSGDEIGCTNVGTATGYGNRVRGYTSIEAGTLIADATFNIMSNNIQVKGTVTIPDGKTLTVNILTGTKTLYAWARTCGLPLHTHSSMPATEQHWTSFQSKPNKIAEVGDVIGCWRCTRSDYSHATFSIDHYYYYSWVLNCGYTEHTAHTDACYSHADRTANNNNYNYSQPALIRASGIVGNIFRVEQGGTLIINGPNGNNLIVDGGTVYSTPYDGTSNMSVEGGSGTMIKANGHISLNRVTLQNGNGICIDAQNDGTVKHNFTLTDVIIRGFKAGAGTAIYFSNPDWHDAILTRVEISGCMSTETSYGGTIRENGGTKTNLTVVDCNIHHNKAKCGGGIYWNAAGISDAKCVVKGNTKIHDNTATLNGGGIYGESRVEVKENVEIFNNTAEYGGGIYLRSYYGINENYDGQGFNTKVTDNVKIYSNTASRYGGGMCLRILNSPDIGFSPSGVAFSPTFSLVVDGGSIHQNHAPKGGGVAILDLAAKHVLGSNDGGGLSGEVIRYVNIEGGTVHDNYTENSELVDTQAGAGFYIRKYEAPYVSDAASGEANPIPDGGYSDLGGAGTITVTASGGLIYNNTTNSGQGGGLHIVNEFYGTDISNDCHVEVTGVAEIYNNISYGNGAGVYVNGGNFEMNGGVIGKEGHPNISYQGNGAGVFVANGNVTINSGHIDYNQAKNSNNTGGYGGAFCLTDGVATINGGSVSHNNADKDGGGFYVDTDDANALTTIKGGATVAYNSAINGGGAFVNKGNFIIQDSGTNLSGNIASVDGGGVYVVNGVVNVNTGAIVQDNRAYDQGGGIYMANGTFNLNGGAIGANEHPNTSDKTGGGVYLGGAGKFNMSGGSIGYNVGTTGGGGAYVNGNDPDPSLKAELNITGGSVNNNSAPNNGANGGGIYVNKGDVLIQNATVSNNTSKGGGAGVYVTKGNVTIDASTVSGNETATGNGGGLFVNNTDNSNSIIIRNGAKINGTNKGKNGGGLYVAKGQVLIEGSTTQISGNQATANGGGIYADGGEITIQGNPTINGNQASVNGGGIYANSDINFNGGTISNNIANSGGGLYIPASSAILNFTNGTFDSNQATANGGGIYISNGATLNLFGNATISGNHVPEGKKGGGVYLRGDLFVGGTDGVQSMQCRTNYAGTSGKAATPNNVFLATNDNYVTLKSDIANSGTNIGISVDDDSSNEKRRVVHVEDASDEKMLWLDNLLEGTTLTGALSDDSQSHIAIHTDNSIGEYNNQFIYFTGCWTTMVQSDPGEQHIQKIGDVYHIKTSQGLSWFSSLVNGVNNQTADRTLNAVLDNDVDMSANIWVPLGSLTYDPDHSSFSESSDSYYTGNFDGQGHVIKGISNGYLSGISKYGLFGAIGSSAKVENTLLDEYSYLAVNAGEYYMGGITGVSTGNATISNCEAKGTMSVAVCNGNSCAGGLVGSMEGTSKAHSSMAMPEFADDAPAIPMGGIAGQAASGTSIKNCFSNVKFGSSSASAPTGGLVGSNAGTIENCYVRLQSGSATPTNWFADGGTVNYCYAPSNATGVQNGTNGNYGDTQLDLNGKYAYEQSDQQVNASNDYVVNGSVLNTGELGGLHATLNKWVSSQTGTTEYSTWTRTMASAINGDYPVLKFDDFILVGSKDNVFLEYGNSLNTMLTAYNAAEGGGSLYLYDSDETTVSTNNDSDVKVYIGQDAGFTQSADNLNARVGVTFDNSSEGFMAYDWHMFSTPLYAAPIGLTNSDTETHSYGYEVPSSALSLSDDGYFPVNTSLSGLDLYCYSEKDFHWINFKRNSNDHWHQDSQDGVHAQIEYNNEDKMYRGKGYMVAIDKPTMLMADGKLTNTEFTIGVTASGGSNPFSGANLIGNPYQGYLDFDAFAANATNSAAGVNAYFILDADAKGYIGHVAGQSQPAYDENKPLIKAYVTSKYIHPHQGFFVHVDSDASLEFKTSMRKATGEGAMFRGEAPAYPLVSLVCTDAEGRNDFTTVELNRPEQGGGEKIKGLHAGDASIWTRLGETDYFTAFATEGTTSVPVRFKAYNDGTFTLRWATANGDFSYLHLIDNMTGMDIDCLTTDSYAFEGSAEDYTSRFKLVFGLTGDNDDDEDATVTGSTFAFMMGDGLVVNGEGTLQVFDLNGRCLLSTELRNQQNTVSLPDVSAGVYVLRMTSGSQVKTQKMVINK